MAAGAYHTVALKSDGTVVAWGYNIYGELGDGTTTNRRTSPLAAHNEYAVSVVWLAGIAPAMSALLVGQSLRPSPFSVGLDFDFTMPLFHLLSYRTHSDVSLQSETPVRPVKVSGSSSAKTRRG